MSVLVGDKLILRCREIYDVASLAADEDLSRALGAASKDVKSYTFKHRAKLTKAIEKKVLRKRSEGAKILASLAGKAAGLQGQELKRFQKDKETLLLQATADKLLSYEPDHVTDVWGCRFVTLYQSEIPRTVAALLTRLEEFNRTHDYDIRLKEFVIYTNRPTLDPLSVVGDVLRIFRGSEWGRESEAGHSVVVDDSVIRQPESRKSAYSSVHFVFSRDVRIQHPGKDEITETAHFEVQIRDIFEEGWGEVQHDLLYSGKDRLEADETGEDPASENWALHLNALKTFVDGCSQHSSIIKREFDLRNRKNLPSSNNPSSSVRWVDRDMIFTALRTNGMRREAELAVSQSYTFLLAAEAAIVPEEARRHYLQAIDKLSDAIAVLGERAETIILPDTRRSVAYYLRTELANCHYLVAEDAERVILSSNELKVEQERGFQRAAELYEEVLRRFPEDPTVLLRSTKAIFRLGKDHAAALKTIDACVAKIADDSLTGSDHWLAVAAWVQKGLIEWVLSRQSEDPAARLGLVESAIGSTIKAHNSWSDQRPDARLRTENLLACHKAMSNILYYLADTILNGPPSAQYGAELLRHYRHLISDMRVDPYKEYYKTRDNIMHADWALGDKDSAKSLAQETFAELRGLAEQRAGQPLDSNEVAAYLQRTELPSFKAAIELIGRFRDG